jgi:hypothetical protein
MSNESALFYPRRDFPRASHHNLRTCLGARTRFANRFFFRRDMRSRPLRDTFLTSRISSNEDLDDSGSTGVPAEGEAA